MCRRSVGLTFVAVLVVLSGCRALLGDFDKYGKNYSAIPLDRIALGNTKEEVEAHLGNPVNVIGSRQYPDGIIEVWAYERWHAQFAYDQKEEEYWLYFVDGRLAQWGRPGDWQAEADKIYELRVR